MTRRGLITVAALGLALQGCAFSEGEPYGVVTASLDARYELRSDRDVGDGSWQKLVSEMEVVIDSATLSVDVVELVEDGPGATTIVGDGSIVFDPASPPPGYTLCHNGHCHSDGGDLVDYEDIIAELAGGGSGESTATTALALSGGAQDLLSDQLVPLSCGDCALSQGYVSLVRATASRLELRGQLRDGLAEPRFEGTRDFTATINLLPVADESQAPGALEADVDLPLDDDSPSAIELALAIAVDASLLDGLDPDAIPTAPEGALAFDDEASVREGFAELPLGVSITRNNP